MENLRPNINIISIVRFLEFLGFLFAYLLLYGLFIKLQIVDLRIASLIFIFSLILIKTDLILYGIKNFRTKNSGIFVRFENFLRSEFQLNNLKRLLKSLILKIKLKSLLKYSIIAFKLLFFNIIYDLFPIFLISMSVFGLFFIFNWINLPKNLDFIGFITAFGILLAIFQYFLQRNETKIFSKINQFAQKINSIIQEETDFNKFYFSIKNGSLEGKVMTIIDPKLAALDLLKDPDLREFLLDLRRHQSPIPLQLNVNYQLNSNAKYHLIETRLIFPGDMEDLKKAYEEFFLNSAFKNIMDRIRDEIDIQEFSILTLSNINIVQEIIPDFINVPLRRIAQKTVENIVFGERMEDITPSEVAFLKFLNILVNKINEEIRHEITLL